MKTDLAGPIQLAGTPAIPGLQFRRFAGGDDIVGMHAVKQATDALETEQVISLDEMRNFYEHLVNCDPRRHVTIAEVDGRIVAYSRVYWKRPQRWRPNVHVLARSLSAMRHAGLTSAALGVDSENPSGALGLYESLGFAPARRYTTYRKPLEEGAA